MRQATDADYSIIRAAVHRLYKESTVPWMKFSDFGKAMCSIAEWLGSGDIWIVGDYAVIAHTGTMWSSSAKMVFEKLVIRISSTDKNPISTVTDFLKALCITEGCAAVVVGDTQRGLMTPVYEKAGFVPLGTQLMWSP
jgi:hypothetical protein